MKEKRPQRGVLICADISDENTVNVTIDDIVNKGGDTLVWEQDVFVTSKDYSQDCFDKMNFDEKNLADFGYYILSRLYAFKKNGDL